MTQPEAYYLPLGDGEFETTKATESPWDTRAQHGGPPAALLAHAIQSTTDDPAMTLARISVDFLGAIPQGRMRVETEVVRPGKRVEMVTARLYADGAPAVAATAWRVRENQGSTAEVADGPADLPALPDDEVTHFFDGVPDDWGYGASIEWRFAEGGFEGLGRASLWTRVRIPLVAGEPIAPVERLLVVADSTNGVSARLPIQQWWSIPPTMTTTIQRVPDGEWTHMRAATLLGPDGRGIAESTMSDERGVLALVSQPLMVARR